jgi:DNA-binding IclR family transcriptional regulator
MMLFEIMLFQHGGGSELALSSSLPKMRVRDRDHEKAIVSALRATADKISEDFRAVQAPEVVSTSRGRR